MMVSFIALAASAFVLGFVRASGRPGAWALMLALVAHALLPMFVPEGEPAVRRTPQPIEVELEIAAPPPPPAIEPPPAPPPPAKAQPIVNDKPQPSTPRPQRARPQRPSVAQPQPAAQPAPAPGVPRRFDLAGDGPRSGISVRSGSPGGTGTGDGNGTARVDHGGPAANEGPPGKAASPWQPASAAAVSRLPQPLRVVERECPATREGIEGTVILRVQIRRDGTVRRVTKVRGIGHGCDEVAQQALARSRFEAASDGGGNPVDFEIQYEYAFHLAR